MPHVTISHFPKDLDEAGRERRHPPHRGGPRRLRGGGGRGLHRAPPGGAEAWDEEVYRPEIAARPELLVKQPGY
ncbi:tautomerase family protein [Streptomyces sp. INA 01156]